MRIGLLGGSFNPAHSGHLHISVVALKRLGLDQIWWLVSPQNPLKTSDDMAPLAERMEEARKVARDRRLRVSDIEVDLGTYYTIETLAALRERYPRVRFVWLMGADNLIQFPRWRSWEAIFRTVPIAVLPRPTYSYKALSGKAAQRFRAFRIRPDEAGSLADRRPPTWVFLPMRETSASATALRLKRRSGRRRTP
jgi:nicotinate-nucleotide adenylyltransferase